MIQIERNATLEILNGADFALLLNYEGTYELFIACSLISENLGQFFAINSCGNMNFNLYRELMTKTLKVYTGKNNDRVVQWSVSLDM